MRAPIFIAYNRSAISKHCLPRGRIRLQPMPRPFHWPATSIVLWNHTESSRRSRRRVERWPAERASMLWRKGHYWRRSAPRARNDADHDLLPVAVLAGCKDPGYGQM